MFLLPLISASSQYFVETDEKLALFRQGSAVLFRKTADGTLQPIAGFCRGEVSDLLRFPIVTSWLDASDALFEAACVQSDRARQLQWLRQWRNAAIEIVGLVRLDESGNFSILRVHCGAHRHVNTTGLVFGFSKETSDISADFDLRPFCHFVFDLQSRLLESEHSCALLASNRAALLAKADEHGNFKKFPYVNNLVLECPGAYGKAAADVFFLPPGERRDSLFSRLNGGQRESEISAVCKNMQNLLFAQLCTDNTSVMPSWITGAAPGASLLFML